MINWRFFTNKDNRKKKYIYIYTYILIHTDKRDKVHNKETKNNYNINLKGTLNTSQLPKRGHT